MSAQKVFCSYAYTGEDQALVRERMFGIKKVLDRLSIQSYCDLFDIATESFTEPQQFIRSALDELAKSDVLLVINTSERRSEGMLIEVGAAITRGLPIIYAQHESSINKTYLPSLANETFVWREEEQLLESIGELFTRKITS